MNPLWRHQVDALRFIRERFVAGRPGTLIAADMGTGKTRIGAEAAHDEIELTGDADILVICPMSVVKTWDEEMCKVLGPRVPRIVHEGGTTTKALRLLSNLRNVSGPLVMILNYEAMLGKLGEEVMLRKWRLIICDEAQRIKSPGGKQSKKIATLANRHNARRLALTGTPTPHSHLDAYGIMRFTDPTIFGTRFENFKHRYTRRAFYGEKEIAMRVKERGEKGRIYDLVPQNMDEFEKRLALATFRVSAADVLDLLPTTTEKRTVNLRNRDTADAYRAMFRKLVAELESGKLTAANRGVRVIWLQQIVNGIVTDDEGNRTVVSDGKMKALVELFDEIPPEEPIVVFGRFHTDLDQIAEAAAQAKRTSTELSGRVHTPTELERWQDGAKNVLAVQIQAGGVGISLTRARHAVWFTMPYSVAEYTQAEARLVRPRANPLSGVRPAAVRDSGDSLDRPHDGPGDGQTPGRARRNHGPLRTRRRSSRL